MKMAKLDSVFIPMQVTKIVGHSMAIPAPRRNAGEEECSRIPFKLCETQNLSVGLSSSSSSSVCVCPLLLPYVRP